MLTGIVILFVATASLWALQKYVVTPNYGQDVQERFLEHLNYIPSLKSPLLSLQTLTIWLEDPKHARDANGYVLPVLFPVDLTFLVALGGLLGLGAMALAQESQALSGIPGWIWWTLPAAYMIVDLLEDIVIALLFKKVIKLSSRSYLLLGSLTRVKLIAVESSIAQFVFLGVLALLLQVFAPSL